MNSNDFQTKKNFAGFTMTGAEFKAWCESEAAKKAAADEIADKKAHADLAAYRAECGF
jgi:hypothetical protein